jgi:hypothetical protein
MSEEQYDLWKILWYARKIVDDHRDRFTGEVDLTGIEEEVMDHFKLSDQYVDDHDISFEIWQYLDGKGDL